VTQDRIDEAGEERWHAIGLVRIEPDSTAILISRIGKVVLMSNGRQFARLSKCSRRGVTPASTLRKSPA